MLRRSNGANKERRPVTLDDLARQAQFAAEGVLDCALNALRERVSAHGKLNFFKSSPFSIDCKI